MTIFHLPQWPLSLDTTPHFADWAMKQYNLQGEQVEPTASYWTDCPAVPCIVTIDQLMKPLPGEGTNWTLPAYPTKPAILQAELDELRELASLRDDPGAVVSNTPGRERRAISTFLNLRPQPLGAVFNRERSSDCSDRCNGRCADRCDDQPNDDVPVILTGRELARYFESETPGIAHRHALNYLLQTTNWSPPR